VFGLWVRLTSPDRLFKFEIVVNADDENVVETQCLSLGPKGVPSLLVVVLVVLFEYGLSESEVDE
jgi:hypothetical protein